MEFQTNFNQISDLCTAINEKVKSENEEAMSDRGLLYERKKTFPTWVILKYDLEDINI